MPMPAQVHKDATKAQLSPMGEQLRRRRKALHLTLKEVAAAAQLSSGFISQIERGITIPSLTSLTNVCRVLNMDVGDFFNVEPKPQEQDEATPLLFGLGKVSPDVVTYERLSASFPDNVLRATFIHEPAGNHSEPMAHEGEEIFYIVSGEITLYLEDESVILKQGDTAHFPSTKVHRTWNHSKHTTTIFHVCTMDVFGGNDHVSPAFPSKSLAVTKHVRTRATHSSSTKGED